MKRMYSKAQIEKIVEDKIGEMPTPGKTKVYMHRVFITYQSKFLTIILYNTSSALFNKSSIIKYLINGIQCVLSHSGPTDAYIASIDSYTVSTGILKVHYTQSGYHTENFVVNDSYISDDVTEV